MNWPTLHVEHLAGAAALNGFALAWFFWGRGHARGAPRAPAWNWLAAAALAPAVRIAVWLFLAVVQLDAWPAAVRPLLATLTAAGGLAAAVAAWAWSGRRATRAGGWLALLAGSIVAALVPPLAPLLAAFGWLALAAALSLAPADGLRRRPALALAAAMALLALAEWSGPDLTQLVLRVPSEQAAQWSSREMFAFGLRCVGAAGGGAVFWLGRHPRHRAWLLGAATLGAAVLALGWNEARRNAAGRARVWAELAELAGAIGPAVRALRAEPGDVARPEFAAVVNALVARESASAFEARFWLWSVRDGVVVHMADAAGRPERPGVRLTPPGYRLTQLPNLALRATRGEHFESGPFFLGGRRFTGLHHPLRAADGTVVAWVQCALPAEIYNRAIADPRSSAFSAVFLVVGAAMLVLAGGAWLEASRELQRQAVEAEARARAKNEMAGLVSHELRTPLQVVLGHLEVLGQTPLADDTRRSLAIVEDQCRRLLGLVNDTLDLCALDAGRLPLRPQRFSPVALAESVVRELRPLAAECGLELALVVGPGVPPLVETDAARVRQILTNLVANALKYTPRGRVALDVARAAGAAERLEFVVRDTGPGLPAAVLARLGEAFHTGTPRQGTGLGLAIVQRLCAHLGGEFSAENAPAGGCVARVLLPAAEVSEVAESGVSRATPATAAAGGRIVLAEDNTLVREMLADYLRGRGAAVRAFADGAEALVVCRAEPPDAVVLDLAMPGLDGVSVARALRAGAFAGRIIGLSAEALGDAEARAAGFDRFLVKPVKLAELAEALATHPSARDTGSAAPPRMLELFRAEAPRLLAELETAAEARDGAKLVRLAHYLQNSAYVLGEEAFGRAGADLKRRVEAGASAEQIAEAARVLAVHVHRHLAASAVEGRAPAQPVPRG